MRFFSLKFRSLGRFLVDLPTLKGTSEGFPVLCESLRLRT